MIAASHERNSLWERAAYAGQEEPKKHYNFEENGGGEAASRPCEVNEHKVTVGALFLSFLS